MSDAVSGVMPEAGVQAGFDFVVHIARFDASLYGLLPIAMASQTVSQALNCASVGVPAANVRQVSPK
jgi:hypothetical protein